MCLVFCLWILKKCTLMHLFLKAVKSLSPHPRVSMSFPLRLGAYAVFKEQLNAMIANSLYAKSFSENSARHRADC